MSYCCCCVVDICPKGVPKRFQFEYFRFRAEDVSKITKIKNEVKKHHFNEEQDEEVWQAGGPTSTKSTQKNNIVFN